MEASTIVHTSHESSHTSQRLLQYVAPKLGDIRTRLSRTTECLSIGRHHSSHFGMNNTPIHSTRNEHIDVVSSCRFDTFDVIGLNFEGQVPKERGVVKGDGG